MRITIDRDIITDQMNNLSLSERTVVTRSGFPTFTFRRARQTGELEGTVPLRQVATLADTLGLTLAQLLASPEGEVPANLQPRTAQQDAAHLIPLLVDMPKMVAVDHVTRAMGWTQPRTLAALEATPFALTGTGLKLHESNGFVKITPINPTDKQLKKALGKIRNLGLGLNAAEAAVLDRVVNGEHVLNRSTGNSQRVALGAVKNMGCIALNHEGVYEITDDLRLALPDL